VADPAWAVLLAWTTVLERFSDLGSPLGAHLTAHEMARATAGRVPAPVTRMLAELATVVDRARYCGDRATDDDAGLAWALADECLARLPTGWAVATVPLRHPRRAAARLRLTNGVPRRRERWTGEVPPSATVLEPAAVPDIAGYEIESRIGVGATAAVYRARQAGSGRAVAIKVFHADVNRRDFDHQRFVWEARVAEMVSGQPGLPEVLGSGFTDAGHPYLVTKLYRHGTLARRVRVGRPLSPDEVIAAGRQLATALDALHQNGVAHGDVKPENVFIDDDDSMVLGDLGAAWVHTVSTVSGPAASLTPAYAAPEVWLGHVPTAASDIYSLGLTLMFAATGRVPQVGSPPSEGEIVAAFGSDVAVRLLEVDPRRRFRTALAVANHFGAELDERTVGAESSAYRLPPPSWTFRG
jgi:serine/threonine protein kinase